MRLFGRSSYSGRLAFDSDSGFHVDPRGKKLVTDDGGKSWRYAKRGDPSHQARYHSNYVVIDSTANAETPEPHHFGVQDHDAHYGGILSDPDVVAEKITSHTESYQ